MSHFIVTIASLLLTAAFAGEQAKPAQPAKPPAAAAALQGTWAIASINGQPVPDGASAMTLTFTGDKYHQTVGGQINERGTTKLDATKKPMTIDLIITEGSDAGKTQLGIIEVTADELRVNFAFAGVPQRPTDFTVKEGSLVVLGKKQKKG